MEYGFQAFTVLLSRLSRTVRRIKTAEMEEFHLKGPHVSCLYYLYITGGLTLTALSERCGEDKAAVSRTLEYLEHEGFLMPNMAGKYRVPLRLTEKGERVGKAIAEKIDRIVRIADAGLTQQELDAMYHALRQIDRNLTAMEMNQ